MICSAIAFNPPQIVGAGDSHMYGNADPANAMPVFLALLLQTYAVFNTGHNGIGWSEVSTFYTTEALPHAKSSTGIPSFYLLDICTNNVNNGQSGASMYAGVAPILATAKANGSFVGATQIWNSPGWSASQITEAGIYRTALATDPSCDFLVNGAALFPDPNDPTYFLGSGHLNPFGQSVYAQAYFNAMRAAGKV